MRLNERDAHDEALGLIASLHVCTLATCGEGRPHAVSLLYAPRRFRIYWLSDPASIHARHLDAVGNGEAAVTIAADQHDFREIRGVQMVGSGRRVEVPEERHAQALLIDRYRYLAGTERRPPEVEAAMRQAAVYCFSPRLVTLIDNRNGFGCKVTFAPPAEEQMSRR